jgi:hypothetical protein
MPCETALIVTPVCGSTNALDTASAPSDIVPVAGTISRKQVSQHPYSLRSGWCMRPPRWMIAPLVAEAGSPTSKPVACRYSIQ